MDKRLISTQLGSTLRTGFSVIDFMVALAALAIVIMVAVPTASALVEKHRLKSASGNLVSGISIARSESDVRSMVVRLCPSSNGHTCRADGNWNHGWLVYSDGNGDGAAQDIELIKVFEAPDSKIRIIAKGAVESGVSFTTAGLMQNQQTTGGEFLVCLSGSNTAPNRVSVDREGWVSSRPGEDAACTRG
jgi:type IV fimbrial biogenesis protein FimT